MPPNGKTDDPSEPLTRKSFFSTAAFQYGLVIILFLAARIAVLISFQSSEYSDFLLVDAKTYDAWGAGALNVEGAYWLSPAYAWFLGGIYGIFGHSLPAVGIIQIALSLGSCFLVMRLSERHFSRAAALAAGAIFALYAPLALHDVLHEKTALTAFFLLASVSFLDLYAASHQMPHLAGGGFALGLAAIMRGNVFILAAAVGIWLIIFEYRNKNRLRWLRPLVFAAAVLLPVMPITLRNAAVTGEFIPVTYSDGFNFYEGNSAEATGEHGAVAGVERTAESEENTACLRAEREEGKSLSPAEVSSFYYGKAFDFIVSSPDAFLAGMFKKTLLFVNRVEIPDNYNYQFMSERLPGLGLLPLGFYLVFPLSVGGIILLAAGRRGRPVALFIIGYALSVIIFYVTDRYRLAIMPVFIICAGGFAVWLFKSLVSREKRKRALVVFAGTVALGALISIPVFGYARETGFSREHFVLAKYYEQAGDHAREAFEYEEMLKYLPPDNTAVRYKVYRRLGAIYANRLGEYEYAWSALHDAAGLAPSAEEKKKTNEALRIIEGKLIAKKYPH
jgi:4-amino-4-deoxy-L-arabinose transferase-like glycosyltransferase